MNFKEYCYNKLEYLYYIELKKDIIKYQDNINRIINNQYKLNIFNRLINLYYYNCYLYHEIIKDIIKQYRIKYISYCFRYVNNNKMYIVMIKLNNNFYNINFYEYEYIYFYSFFNKFFNIKN